MLSEKEKEQELHSSPAEIRSLCRNRALIASLERRLARSQPEFSPCMDTGKKRSPLQFKPPVGGNFFLAAAGLSVLLSALSGFWPPLVTILIVINMAAGMYVLGEAIIARLSGYSHEDPLWKGWTGFSVMFFGVFLPSVAVPGLALFSWSQMNASTASFYFMSLAIPVGNLQVWKWVRRNGTGQPGLAMFFLVLALIIESCALAGQCLRPQTSEIWLTAFMLMEFVISAFLLAGFCRQKSAAAAEAWKAAAAALVVTAFWSSLDSLAIATCGLHALMQCDYPSVRSWATKTCKKCDILEEELLEQSSAAGLNTLASPLGQLLRLSPDAAAEDFFQLTGKPVWQALPDDDLDACFYTAPTVGPRSAAVACTSSQLVGHLHPQELSARYDWTFAFRNNTFGGQEARVEISLPRGCVLTGLYLPGARNDRSEGAVFDLIEKTRKAYALVVEKRKDPAHVTMVAPNKALLQVAPVLNNNTPVQVRVRIASRAYRGKSAQQGIYQLPHIVASNCNSLIKTSVRLHSPLSFALNGQAPAKDADFQLEEKQKTGNLVAINLEPGYKTGKAVLHPVEHSTRQRLIGDGIRPPARLVVAVDGSCDMSAAVSALTGTLKNLPASMIDCLLFADPQSGIRQAATLESFTQLADEARFDGGGDNWKLLARAHEIAKDHNADVLWIHSPKPWPGLYNPAKTGVPGVPVLSRNLNQLCKGGVRIFDFSTAEGSNQILEKMQAAGNDISSFVSLERSDSLEADLRLTFAGWAGGNEKGKTVPVSAAGAKATAAFTTKPAPESIDLANTEKLNTLIAAGQRKKAEEFAIGHHLLSIYTGALLLESPDDYKNNGFASFPGSTSIVDGATKVQINSTNTSPSIKSSAKRPDRQSSNRSRHRQHQQHELRSKNRPTKSNIIAHPTPETMPANGIATAAATGDATVIQGVNTTGTVRVNNLASLEALLNILANGMEIFGLAWGLPMIIIGIMRNANGCPDGMVRLILGFFSVTFGLATPGVINWLVSSSRDVNVFS
jgi:hypothetical protein